MDDTQKKDWKKAGLGELVKAMIAKIHFSRGALFPSLGFFLVVILVLFMGFMIRFLGENLQNAFSPVIPHGASIRFDMEGFKKLDLKKLP